MSGQSAPVDHECDRNPCRVCGVVRCTTCGAPATHRNDLGGQNCEQHSHNEDGTPGLAHHLQRVLDELAPEAALRGRDAAIVAYKAERDRLRELLGRAEAHVSRGSSLSVEIREALDA